MKWPNWSKVRLVYLREMLDQRRDRRTLFMVAILPLLLYPLVAIGMMQATQFLKRHPSKVLVLIHGDELTPQERSQIGDRLLDAQPPLVKLHFRWSHADDGNDVRSSATKLIQQGSFDLVAELPQSMLPELIVHDETDDATADTRKIESTDSTSVPDSMPQLYYLAALDRSFLAYQRFSTCLDEWRQTGRPSIAAVDPPVSANTVVEDPSVVATNLSSARMQRAAMWSKILPLIVFVWALTGAFYPAVDFCAGEKERGTLETLLASAAERIDIVWGKLLAVMTFSAGTALLNMACMLLTASLLVRQVAGLTGSDALAQVSSPPWSVLPWLVIALIPIAALFSSLALALASMARSTKEGQYYLVPLLLIFTPLMMLAIVPTIRLDLGTSLLPVTGIMLCLRHLMEGEFTVVWSYALPALSVTFVCCAIAIRWAVEQFNNEDVLFHSGERTSFMQWLRSWRSARPVVPTAGQAILCGIVILFFRFFAGGAIGFPDTWQGFAQYTAGTLIAFIAAPALIMTWMLTSSPSRTLMLARPTAITVIASIALAVCLHPFATVLMITIRECYPIDMEALAPLKHMLESAPNSWSLLVILALLPAVCEEIAFRGFILSGFRSHGTRLAMIGSSLLFAVAHGALQQSLLAGVFGMILAYLALRTNCLGCCIAFHATHNALGLLSADWLPRWGATWRDSPWLFQALSVPGSEEVIYSYGIAILLPGILAGAAILTWFSQGLPFGRRATPHALQLPA